MDKNNLSEIKKLFTKYGSVNFFKEYTLQDVEEAKKKSFIALCLENNNIEQIQNYLDSSALQLVEHKFNNNDNKNVGVVVKNTVKDNLNPNYKNTIKRIICVDSQYRPNIYNYNDPDTNECNFTINLSEKLTNVVNIQIENIHIPFTFYNIEYRKNNNFFYIDSSLIEVPDNNYTISTLLTEINQTLIKNSINDLSFNLTSQNKVSITSTTTHTITFYNSLNFEDFSVFESKDTTYLSSKGNNNLGWYLGFRDILIDDTHIEIIYTITNTEAIISDAIPMIPNTKYFTIVVNDYNQNQANGTDIQSKLDLNYIKPTTYFNFQNTATNKTLDCLNCNNINEYIKDPNRQLTKSQLYSRAEVNKHRTIMQPNYRVDCKTQNYVLAVIPFDASIPFGSMYFNDKIDYKREYHGPVEIEKLHFELYDDKGLLMNLNGNNWNMVMYTEHLYKY